MSEPTFESFRAHLSMLLRDLPPGITADLLDGVCAYWNGYQVIGLYLREDDSGRLDEDFEFDDNVWLNWRDELLAWQAAPKFTSREELQAWLRDTSLDDAGA